MHLSSPNLNQHTAAEVVSTSTFFHQLLQENVRLRGVQASCPIYGQRPWSHKHNDIDHLNRDHRYVLMDPIRDQSKEAVRVRSG